MIQLHRPNLAILLVVLQLAACAGSRSAAGGSGGVDLEATQRRSSELFALGRTEEAIAEARRADEAAWSDPSAGDATRIGAALQLASFLMQAGHLDEAASVAERAHATAADELREAQVRRATTLKFAGVLHANRGEFAAARASHEEAIALTSAALGPNDPETAKHVGNLAAALLQAGETEEGRRALLQAIAIWDAQPTPHPVYAGGALMNLATVDFEQGRHEEAFATCRRALGLQEAAFGADSPRLTNTLQRYASLLRIAGREGEADEVEARVAAIRARGAGS